MSPHCNQTLSSCMQATSNGLPLFLFDVHFLPELQNYAWFFDKICQIAVKLSTIDEKFIFL